jgi:hypothetical protein
MEKMKAWHQSPMVRENGCMECRSMGTTHEVEGLGIICKACIEKARECRKEGCEGIGTESMDGLCRAHYMGDFDELHIDDFGGFKASSLAGAYKEAPKRVEGESTFSKDLTESMRKKGMPTKAWQCGLQLFAVKE